MGREHDRACSDGVGSTPAPHLRNGWDILPRERRHLHDMRCTMRQRTSGQEGNSRAGASVLRTKRAEAPPVVIRVCQQAGSTTYSADTSRTSMCTLLGMTSRRVRVLIPGLTRRTNGGSQQCALPVTVRLSSGDWQLHGEAIENCLISLESIALGQKA